MTKLELGFEIVKVTQFDDKKSTERFKNLSQVQLFPIELKSFLNLFVSSIALD